MNDTKKLLKNLSNKPRPQNLVPIATDMFVPNHSGTHDAGILNKTPTKDNDLVNKKYVDDQIAGVSESDTLQTVTDRGNTTTNNITIDNGGLTNNNLNLNGSTHSTLRSTATDKFQILHNGNTVFEADTLANTTFVGNVSSDIFKGYTYGANSYLDFDDDSYKDNSTTLASIGSMSFLVDSNNNSSKDQFTWNFDTLNDAGRAMVLGNTGSLRLGNFDSSSKSKFIVEAINASSADDYIALFHENGITPEDSAVLSTASDRAISVQGAGGAFYMGRDVTNDIEFIMGISSLGEAFAGSVTNHNFSLRTNNQNRLTIDTNGDISTVGDLTVGDDLNVIDKLIVGSDIVSAPVLAITSTQGANITTNLGAVALAVESVISSGAGGGAGIVAYSNDGAAMGSGDRLGYYLFGGASTSSAVVNSCGITGFTAGSWTSTSTPSELRFETTPTSTTSRSVRMTINKDGNVGIANTNPSYKLDVTGEINATTGYRINGTAGASGSFTTADGKTVTVTNGLITAIV